MAAFQFFSDKGITHLNLNNVRIRLLLLTLYLTENIVIHLDYIPDQYRRDYAAFTDTFELPEENKTNS